MGRKSRQRSGIRHRLSLCGQRSLAARFWKHRRCNWSRWRARYLLSGSPVIISEIEASNNTGIMDSNATPTRPDWLEITNTSSTQAVNLNNWVLSYKYQKASPKTWTFPNMLLGRCESRVIFCDSSMASETDPLKELNTGFGLSASGNNLALLDNTGTVISSYMPYPAMVSDTSYGVGETVAETDLVLAGATAWYLAPTSNSLDTVSGSGPTWPSPATPPPSARLGRRVPRAWGTAAFPGS